ncbi:MAG: hypothetical protein AB1791_13745 [Chloroflexota bacterium]
MFRKQSIGSKLGALSGLIITIAFFLPGLRACNTELSGYDLATGNTAPMIVEDPWLYWATPLAGLFCIVLLFLVRTDRSHLRIPTAAARLVAGIVGTVPLLNIWYNVEERGVDIEILPGGWLEVLGAVGILLSFVVDLRGSSEKTYPALPISGESTELKVPDSAGQSDTSVIGPSERRLLSVITPLVILASLLWGLIGLAQFIFGLISPQGSVSLGGLVELPGFWSIGIGALNLGVAIWAVVQLRHARQGEYTGYKQLRDLSAEATIWLVLQTVAIMGEGDPIVGCVLGPLIIVEVAIWYLSSRLMRTRRLQASGSTTE